MNEKEVKAFRCAIPDVEDEAIVFATTAGKAGYRTFLSAQECGYVNSITQVRTRRAPEYDHRRPLRDVEAPGCWSEDHIRDYGVDA